MFYHYFRLYVQQMILKYLFKIGVKIPTKSLMLAKHHRFFSQRTWNDAWKKIEKASSSKSGTFL